MTTAIEIAPEDRLYRRVAPHQMRGDVVLSSALYMVHVHRAGLLTHGLACPDARSVLS